MKYPADAGAPAPRESIYDKGERLRASMKLFALGTVLLGLAPTASEAGSAFYLGEAKAVQESALSAYDYVVDGSVFSTAIGGQVRLYVTSGVGDMRLGTLMLSGSSLETLGSTVTPILYPGCPDPSGFFQSNAVSSCPVGADRTSTLSRVYDKCGAWLLGAITDGGTSVVGLYHAEELCDYGTGGGTLKSIAIAESMNSGDRFRKIGQVIAANPAELPATLGATPSASSPLVGNWGQGDHSVIEVNGVPYLYFAASSPGNGTGVARLTNGAWFKWDGSGFNQPGRGGTAADTHAWARSASKNATDLYVVNIDSADPINRISYWTSPKTSGTSFTKSNSVLMAASATGSLERIEYPSIIPPGGDSYRHSWTTSFYLFYGLTDPYFNNQTFMMASDQRRRRLVMRKVDVVSGSASDVSLTGLSRYFDSNRSKHRATTQPPESGYALESVLGYLYNEAGTGRVELMECYDPTKPGYRLMVTACAGGTYLVRRVGWINVASGNGVQNVPRKPLQECTIPGWNDFFYNNSVNCGGWPMGAVLGYVEAHP